jgi:hypothetical protein
MSINNSKSPFSSLFLFCSSTIKEENLSSTLTIKIIDVQKGQYTTQPHSYAQDFYIESEGEITSVSVYDAYTTRN